MQDDYCAPDDDYEETPFTLDAYAAGTGAAAQGQTLPDAIRQAEESGAPFGSAERAALKAGFIDYLTFRMDMRTGADRPRAA